MSSTPADLQALFASLKPRAASGSSPASENPQQQQQQPVFHYAPPSVSSPLYSPAAAGSPPHHGSDIISPDATTPRSEHNAQTNPTADLLNLLRFNNARQNTNQETIPAGTPKPAEAKGMGAGGHGRGVSASDLVAQFMVKPEVTNVSGASTSPGVQLDPGSSVERPLPASSPSGENAQNMLLRLLNRPKPQQTKSTDSVKGAAAVSPPADVDGTPAAKSHEGPKDSTPDGNDSPVRAFGTDRSREATPFDPQQPHPPSSGTIFSYVNPFEQLAAASPRPRATQNGKAPAGAAQTPSSKDAMSRDRSGDVSEAMASASETVVTTKKLNERPEAVNVRPEKKLKTKESVPEALEGLAGKVDTEVESALARAAGEKPAEEDNGGVQKSEDAVDKVAEEAVKNRGADERLEKEPSRKSSVKEPSEVLAESTKAMAEDKKTEGLVDSWESESERIVPVYNFPLKPFVSITWKGNTTDQVSIRDDGFMDIARLKKGFDQLDRSLTSATSDYIVYALAKNGGMRVIRQDDGHDRQVFRSANDRIFNVALCRSGTALSKSKEEAVLGIGVSGTVYWATLIKDGDDLFERNALGSKSLIIPPFPTSDENASGGQLKTRARPSSCHPKFFAIGRGKSIHIVWPHAAMSPKYGVTSGDNKVNTEKFFKERSLKIATGKAGKDFIFSHDDTVIVSLDKTGRMRFWDIREMGDADTDIPKPDIRVPLLTFVTGSPNEKSWPTSVLFIDKLRPYTKACALRYVLVGLRQNHTLQLWDIGLGKAVQEISFPHSKESDGICSVAYHPGSGIIVVGHPTRNSIYFIHFSAPRYSLATMSQGVYLKYVADKDERLPKPQSTACMSGIRELSFGSRGQLRSLELLPLADPPTSSGVAEDETGLFELYVMHSRGVTCLNIKRADLGWSVDNSILQPVNALEKGFIEIKDLQDFSPADDQSLNGEGTPQASTGGNNKESIKKPDVEVEKSAQPSQTPKKSAIDVPAGSQQDQPAAEKKKKKRAAETATKAKELGNEAKPPSPANNGVEQAQSRQPPVGKPEPSVPSTTPTTPAITPGLLNEEIKKIERSISTEFQKCLSHELDSVYRRFEDDRHAQDATSVARQDAVLRLVSSTLSDNVEKNLARIISSNIESTVVPSLKDVTATSLDKKVNEALKEHLGPILTRSVNSSLPNAISKAMQAPETLRAISELVTPAIAHRVEEEVTSFTREKILPSVHAEYVRSTNQMISDVEKLFSSKLNQYETQRTEDSVKIDQLTAQVHSLTEMVGTMATSQAKFQSELLEMNRHVEIKQEEPQRQTPTSVGGAQRRAAPQSDEDLEVEEIAGLMAESKYEEASVKWLQSSQQAALFDRIFVKFDPSYLFNLSPLVSLSVSAAVTSSLSTNILERLGWLHLVFQTVDVKDPDIIEVAPKIMDVLIQRLDALYMSIAQHAPHDPILRRIPPLTRWARDLRELNNPGRA